MQQCHNIFVTTEKPLHVTLLYITMPFGLYWLNSSYGYGPYGWWKNWSLDLWQGIYSCHKWSLQYLFLTYILTNMLTFKQVTSNYKIKIVTPVVENIQALPFYFFLSLLIYLNKCHVTYHNLDFQNLNHWDYWLIIFISIS
jgi:hypothetical protein